MFIKIEDLKAAFRNMLIKVNLNGIASDLDNKLDQKMVMDIANEQWPHFGMMFHAAAAVVCENQDPKWGIEDNPPEISIKSTYRDLFNWLKKNVFVY
jgi:hypothetical protein